MKEIHSSCEECKFVKELKQKVVGGVEPVYFCTKHGFNVNKNEWCPEGQILKEK